MSTFEVLKCTSVSSELLRRDSVKLCTWSAQGREEILEDEAGVERLEDTGVLLRCWKTRVCSA